MFVYQNKDNAVCITFQDNKPVEAPEYVITVDKEAKTLTISGAASGENEVTDYSAELEAANKDIAAKDAEIATLTAQIEELEAEIEELKAATAE